MPEIYAFKMPGYNNFVQSRHFNFLVDSFALKWWKIFQSERVVHLGNIFYRHFCFVFPIFIFSAWKLSIFRALWSWSMQKVKWNTKILWKFTLIFICFTVVCFAEAANILESPRNLLRWPSKGWIWSPGSFDLKIKVKKVWLIALSRF